MKKYRKEVSDYGEYINILDDVSNDKEENPCF